MLWHIVEEITEVQVIWHFSEGNCCHCLEYQRVSFRKSCYLAVKRQCR